MEPPSAHFVSCFTWPGDAEARSATGEGTIGPCDHMHRRRGASTARGLQAMRNEARIAHADFENCILCNCLSQLGRTP
eukprot:843284-Amphidinium_carterae.1